MIVPATPLSLLILDTDGEGISTFSWRVQTGEVIWSSGIDALFGLPPNGFGGTYAAYLELVHPEDRAHFQAVIERTLAGEDEYVMSHRVLWPDGSVHWIDGRGRLTRDDAGKPLQLDGVSWDARVREQTEARFLHLHRAQAIAGAVRRELLRATSDQDAFDRACRIVVEHGRFRFAWVGVLVENGSRVAPVASFGVEDGYLADAGIVFDLRTAGRGPVERTLREGDTVVVNDITTDPCFASWREAALCRGYRGFASLPLRRGGQIIGVVCAYASVVDYFDTAQLQLLIGLVDDIGFTLDVIDEAALRRRMQEQLVVSDRLASLGRLAAGVAHEVNNPLAYVMLSFERITRALEGAPDSEMVSEIRAAATQAQDGADRVRAVVRALGSFGREDHGALGAVDVHRVLDAAVRLADSRVRSRGRVVKDFAAKQGVRAHELRLGQVFVNLLINAADALPDGAADKSEIRVRTFDEGREVVVEIEDDGAGISPDLLGRIFDPFFTTKDVGAGTGLGLSISHSILDSFGATICVDSTPGVGSVFRVKLLAAEMVAGS